MNEKCHECWEEEENDRGLTERSSWHEPTGFSSMMVCAFAFAPDMSTARPEERRRRRNEMMGEVLYCTLKTPLSVEAGFCSFVYYGGLSKVRREVESKCIQLRISGER